MEEEKDEMNKYALEGEGTGLSLIPVEPGRIRQNKSFADYVSSLCGVTQNDYSAFKRLDAPKSRHYQQCSISNDQSATPPFYKSPPTPPNQSCSPSSYQSWSPSSLPSCSPSSNISSTPRPGASQAWSPSSYQSCGSSLYQSQSSPSSWNKHSYQLSQGISPFSFPQSRQAKPILPTTYPFPNYSPIDLILPKHTSDIISSNPVVKPRSILPTVSLPNGNIPSSSDFPPLDVPLSERKSAFHKPNLLDLVYFDQSSSIDGPKENIQHAKNKTILESERIRSVRNNIVNSILKPSSNIHNENIPSNTLQSSNIFPLDLRLSKRNSSSDLSDVSSSPEPTSAILNAHMFQTLLLFPDKVNLFSYGDFKVESQTSKKIRVRWCPPDDYDDFAESLFADEGLCIASPVIQIEDFDNFVSNGCKELYLRHNIHDWEEYQSFQLRCYSNIQHVSSYVNIEANMFEDYIKVRGHANDNEKGGGKEQVSGANNQQQRNHRNNSSSSSNSSYDEGYGRQDESPKPTMRTILAVAKPDEICDVRLYFAREKTLNMCRVPHEIAIFVVLDRKQKIADFMEKEIHQCEMEEAAKRIRVAIFHDQIYAPILGESCTKNPTMTWEDTMTCGSFSYSMLNKKRGFLEIQKMPPPLTL